MGHQIKNRLKIDGVNTTTRRFSAEMQSEVSKDADTIPGELHKSSNEKKSIDTDGTCANILDGSTFAADDIEIHEFQKAPQTDSQRIFLINRPSQKKLDEWREASCRMEVDESSTIETSERDQWIKDFKPKVRHSGWLIKKGHNIRNFKRRLFFIVDDRELVYHDSHDSSEVCGRVDLTKETQIHKLSQSGFRIFQTSYQMILYALDEHDRDIWIKQLSSCANVSIRLGGINHGSGDSICLSTDVGCPDTDTVLFSGWLRKRGQVIKSIKRRWFELTKSSLSYYSDPEKTSKKGFVDIGKAQVYNLDAIKTGERHSFLISTSTRVMALYADSEEDRALWVAHLCSVARGSSHENNIRSILTLSPQVLCDLNRDCSCSHIDIAPADTAHRHSCRRCMASFKKKLEDALSDVSKEVMLILASPYSPEGSTSAAFVRKHREKHTDPENLMQLTQQFMAGLANYMIHTRMKELAMLGGNPSAFLHQMHENTGQDTLPTEEFSDRIVEIIYCQIEERILPHFYCNFVDYLVAQTETDNNTMMHKLKILQTKAQTFFGVSASSVSPSNWRDACRKLKQSDSVDLPYLKKKHISAACREIYLIYHQEHPTCAPMNADEFIPAFIFAVIHAGLDNPLLTKYLIKMLGIGTSSGEDAYFITCLEIAIDYIGSLLTACTANLDANRSLGTQFAFNARLNAVVVDAVIPGSQADTCGSIHAGQVLIAINGVPVHRLSMEEVNRMIAEVSGIIELCFLSSKEYEQM